MKKFSKWKNLNYKLESKFINSIFISNCVQQFWNEIISKLDKKDRIAIQLKLQDSISNSYKTISSVQVIANDSLLLPKIKEICVCNQNGKNIMIIIVHLTLIMSA